MAAPNCAMLGYRSRGALASARATTLPTTAGTAGFVASVGGIEEATQTLARTPYPLPSSGVQLKMLVSDAPLP